MRKILLSVFFVITAALNLSAQTSEAVNLENDDFKISLSNFTFCDFDIKVEPKVADMKYILGVRTLKSLKEDFGDLSMDDAIFAFEEQFYEFFASMYADKTWLDIRAIMSMQGEQDGTCSELLGRVDYDSDVVFYAYGIDDKGNVTTELTKAEFRTPGPTPVDMTFSVTFKEITPTSVSATIVPSLDDQPYYVNIQSTDFTDSWAEDPDGMMLKLVYNSLPKEYYSLMWIDGGTYELAPTTFYIRKNRNYNIIVFGFNNGPTTKPFYFPFSTYEVDLGVDAIQSAGESDNAPVYSLDGKLVMKNSTEESIKALPKGVYVINKKKVVVR